MHNLFKARASLRKKWHKKKKHGTMLFSYFIIFALLLALAYRDLKDYILPNVLNAALALSFLSFHMFSGWQFITPLQSLLGAAAGGSMLLAIRAGANRHYKTDALGLGDVKLMTAAGIGLGFPDIFMALSAGAFAGLLHGIYIGITHRKKGESRVSWARVNVPAGVGLCLGIALTILYRFGFAWLNS